MSHAATAWAYAAPIRNAGRKFVLVALADFADEAWTCYPGQERIAAMTGQDVRSVRRHIEALEDDGFIERTTRHLANGRRTSDRYRLTGQPASETVSDTPVLVHPDNLTGGQSDHRSITTAPPVNLSGDPLVEPSALPPNPPATESSDCDPAYPRHPRCRGCGTTRRALTKAKRLSRPPWCGHCDKLTRLVLVDGDPDHPARCKTCHPAIAGVTLVDADS